MISLDVLRTLGPLHGPDVGLRRFRASVQYCILYSSESGGGEAGARYSAPTVHIRVLITHSY
jgi:hypothetical protein